MCTAILLSSGCELRDAGCVADDECREGRVCADDGSCRDLTNVDTNAATNAANGGTNGVNSANGDPNNVNADPNNVNADPNNVNADPNNVNGDPNNVNGDPNNVNGETNGQTPFCDSAEDCEDTGAPVCSWRGDDPETLVCTAAQMCAFSGGFAGGNGCGFIWDCPDSEAVVECRQRDDGTSRCTCVRERRNGGEVQEFETDENLCRAADPAVANTVNILCGWRLPVEPF